MCLEEFQTPITCILGNPGFFQEMGWGFWAAPSGLLEDTQPCSVPWGHGHGEEPAPRADLRGVNGVQGSGLANSGVSYRKVNVGKGSSATSCP